MASATVAYRTAAGHERGALVGIVLFSGTPPPRRSINADADPKCAELHRTDPLLTEDVIVNTNGTLRNVFIYLKSGLEGLAFRPSTEAVVLNQVGCRYEPHVSGILVGQALMIRNNDDTLHNVHSLSVNNPEINIGQPNRGMRTLRKFSRPEIMVQFKCDVHPWMRAYLGVLDHPFFAVTAGDGEFVIQALPPGDYEIEAWHETLGTISQSVTSDAQHVTEITFTYQTGHGL